MYKKLYYLLMSTGYLAVFVMLGIVLMLLTSCSPLIEALPDKDIDLTVPPKLVICCIPDADFPKSCDGMTLCEVKV